MGCHLDIFQPVALGVAVLLIRHDNYVGGNRVAGEHVIEGCGGLDLIRHGHGLHETRDGLAINDGGLLRCVNRHYFAGKGIALGDRAGAMAGRTEKRDEEYQGNWKDNMFVHAVNTLTPSESPVLWPVLF